MKKKTILAILCLASLNSYSQDAWKMQVWSKNGNVYQFNTEELDSVTFVKDNYVRDWEGIMKFPSESEINQIDNTSHCRSPYPFVMLDTDVKGGFVGYAIDFKADYLPSETYCSLANFHIDYSSLAGKYDQIWNDGGIVNGYAGFQSASKRNMNDYQGILSIWDSYGIDHSGKKDTIQATLIYPENTEGISFNHENDGMSHRPQYNWKQGKWYRVFIQCIEPEDGKNTQIEFWVNDLEEKKQWTKLCAFDLGARGLYFSNTTGVFLENWEPKSCGEIRTLEFKNAKILDRENKWQNIYSGNFTTMKDSEDICYTGSYQYGADETTFWMITTGVSNCATPQPELKFAVKYIEPGNPLEVK